MSEYRQRLQVQGRVENSIRRSVIGVRQLFKFIQEDQNLDRSPMEEAIIPKREDVFNHRLSEEDMASLLSKAGSQESILKAARDEALLCLLGFEGLKVHELIDLKWGDIVRFKKSAQIKIRRDRIRVITLDERTHNALLRLKGIYADRFDLKIRDLSQRPVFFGFKGSGLGRMECTMTRHGVKFALYELGQMAGIDHLNTEDLRHFAISHKIRMGFSHEEVMHHLGLRTPGKTRLHSSKGLGDDISFV